MGTGCSTFFVSEVNKQKGFVVISPASHQHGTEHLLTDKLKNRSVADSPRSSRQQTLAEENTTNVSDRVVQSPSSLFANHDGNRRFIYLSTGSCACVRSRWHRARRNLPLMVKIFQAPHVSAMKHSSIYACKIPACCRHFVPHATTETPLHDKKDGAWCTISRRRLTVLVYDTVICDCYFQLIL